MQDGLSDRQHPYSRFLQYLIVARWSQRKYYVVKDGANRFIVCEKHLRGNKAEFAGVGLSCRFCREEAKLQKSLWTIIPR